MATYKGRPAGRYVGTAPLTKRERLLRGRAADAFVEAQIREMQRLYTAAAERLRRELMGQDLTLARSARISGLLRAIEAEVAALNRQAAELGPKAVFAAYRRGVDTAAQHLEDLGVRNLVLPGSGLTADSYLGTTLHREAVAVLADQMTMDLLQANGQIQVTADRFIRQSQLSAARDRAMTRIVTEGVIEGARRRDVSDQLLTMLREQVATGGFVTINGRKYKAEWYAELVARTRTREAVNQGRLNTAVENDIDLFEIDTHEAACPECRQYVGRVYSITGRTQGFPRLVAMPPFHPFCRCNGYPVPHAYLKELPYYDELKQFSNDPEADFEEYEAKRQAIVTGGVPFGTVPSEGVGAPPEPAYGVMVPAGDPDAFLGARWDWDMEAKNWFVGEDELQRGGELFSFHAVQERKARICRELSRRTGLDEELVNQFIRQWARTSNDNDYGALLTQRVAAETFGVELAGWQQDRYQKVLARRLKELKEYGEVYSLLAAPFETEFAAPWPSIVQAGYPTTEDAVSAALRHMYGWTQTELRRAGIQRVRLYRGITVPKDDNPFGAARLGDTISYFGNTLESWSMDPRTAQVFAGAGHDRISYVLCADVPADRIVGTARTGFGCSDEWEWVIIGNQQNLDNVRIVWMRGP